jgi:hypothetical protein
MALCQYVPVTTFTEPRNRFQDINSASLCCLAGQYDNPICLTGPPLQATKVGGIDSLESIAGLLESLQIRALDRLATPQPWKKLENKELSSLH